MFANSIFSSPESFAQWLAPQLLTLWGLLLLSLTGTLCLRMYKAVEAPRPSPSPGRRLVWVLPALLIFATLASQIGPGKALHRFDSALAQALGQQMDRLTLQAFALPTWLGNPAPVTVLTIGVTLFLLWRRERLQAGIWLLGVLGNTLLNWSLKQGFARVRPPHLHGVVVETGYSFPSGHASGVLVTYGLLTWLVLQHSPRRWHLPAVLACTALVLTAPLSRVLLQVHYASDVLAGLASGSVWLLLCLSLADWLRQRPPAQGR
ncbi:MAG: phosphatase PAP2 family protein [Curvibacter sp.]|nr:MAG: phosphatase PAP2 family protein [Curvibacter sp.]